MAYLKKNDLEVKEIIFYVSPSFLTSWVAALFAETTYDTMHIDKLLAELPVLHLPVTLSVIYPLDCW